MLYFVCNFFAGVSEPTQNLVLLKKNFTSNNIQKHLFRINLCYIFNKLSVYINYELFLQSMQLFYQCGNLNNRWFWKSKFWSTKTNTSLHECFIYTTAFQSLCVRAIVHTLYVYILYIHCVTVLTSCVHFWSSDYVIVFDLSCGQNFVLYLSTICLTVVFLLWISKSFANAFSNRKCRS